MTWRGRAAAVLVALVLGSTAAPIASGAQQGQWTVWHQPYLQQGDAPLPGYPGSESDRIQIRWQTRGAGVDSADLFVVEYRPTGAGAWLDAGPVTHEDLAVATRVQHHVDLLGLEWNTEYDYRVQHVRGDRAVAEYSGSFLTRLEPGDPTPFSFAAYGDSACGCDLAPFRMVQRHILGSRAAFTLLLGDNVYESGTHLESDNRFRADLSPEAVAWRAGHVDHAAYGNHDIGSDGFGAATEAAYAVPIQVAGVTAAVAPPAEERPGHDYSFDYGIVHFVTFDSNALDDPDRLAPLAAWLEADLRASDAQWKIVFAHHPVAGVPDKPEAPDGVYYRTVVAALQRGGADLFMVGHSHTFGWTFPLTGNDGAAAAFVFDPDRDHREGSGVIQVVAGVGGKGLRSGGFSRFPFVEEGFSQSTDPASEFGYALVDVTSARLVISYVSAEDGAVLGSFTVEAARLLTSGWWHWAPLAV